MYGNALFYSKDALRATESERAACEVLAGHKRSALKQCLLDAA